MSARAIEGNRALVAREVAALRRHGWPAGRALRLVAEKVPPGPDRDALAQVAAALEAGRRPDAQADSFLAVLALGDAAGLEALIDVARAEEAARGLRLGWMQVVALPAVLLCIALTSLMFIGKPEEMWFLQFGGAVPAPTVFALRMMEVLRWLTPAVIVGVALLAWRFPRERIPGLRTLCAAAALRRVAVALSAGRTEKQAVELIDPTTSRLHQAKALRLDPYERALLFTLGEQGPAEAARRVADELEADAARSLRRVRVLGPTLGVVVAMIFVALMAFFALASYLPIFTLAGGI